MNRNFTKAVIISLLAHAVFFSFLIYYNRQGEEPFGSNFVSVEIIGDESGTTNPPSPPFTKGGMTRLPPFEKGGPGGISDQRTNGFNGQNGLNETSTLTPTLSHQGRGGLDSPGSATGNPILAKIRNKIERSKYYPQQARLQRLEGRPEVSFKIAPNGTVGSVQLIRSSGNDLLDSAAIETVNRAAPLPYYEEPISIAIKYSLAN